MIIFFKIYINKKIIILWREILSVQNANRNNMEENNEVDNRNRVNVIHIQLRQGNNVGRSNEDENME